MKKQITPEIVKKIASLAKLPISEENFKKLQGELEVTFEYINKIQKLVTVDVVETSQVTGLENVFREDEVKPSLTQEEVLKNAKRKHKGYFMVDAIFEE